MRRNSTSDKELTAVASGVDESQWRKLHPITPLARTWAVFVAIIAFLTYQNAQFLQDIGELGIIETFGLEKVLFAVAGSLVLLIVVAGLYSWLAWRRMSFAVTDEAVYYREGILNRVQRHARLTRIQAVNISHPLIGRIFGLGNIDIEVAGGADSNFRFGLLKSAELESLRREIMIKSAGAKRGVSPAKVEQAVEGSADSISEGGLGLPAGESGATGGGPAHAGSGGFAATEDLGYDNREQQIFKVPPMRLLASILTNIGGMLAIMFGLALAGFSLVMMIVFHAPLATLLPALFGGLAVFGWSWGQFSTNFNFTAYVTSDGIRVTSGLTSTRAQTIAPRKIHGISVKQPFFWRYFGWYKVTILQAGFAVEAKEKIDHSVLLPVGTRDQMLQALWMVYPDLGTSRPIDVINFGIEGEGEGLGFTANPERSKLFDPLVWRRRSIALTDVAILLRDGRITRLFTVLPYGRLQSTHISQGPWDRKRDLVTLRFDMVQISEDSSMAHLDAATGVQIYEEITRRALLKREMESPQQWADRAFEAAGRGAGELFHSEVPQDAPMTVAESDESPEAAAMAQDFASGAKASATAQDDAAGRDASDFAEDSK
ncbi:MAG: PH domain-containing protein [Actinomycetaceae bacterium]|nr:PH domain-containing protein [Actinomycetaceae bacterium]